MTMFSRAPFARIALALLLAAAGGTSALAKKKHRPDDVILIHNVQELQNIQNSLSGSYRLANDIDATGFNFVPIGTQGSPFNGALDGNGYAIRNLSFSSASECIQSHDCAGLFGVIDTSGLIRNLRILNLAIDISCAVQCSAGGIAAMNAGTITTSFVQGHITTQNTQTHSDPWIGGAAGVSGNLFFVAADVAIKASGAFCDNYVGGLIGDNAGGTVRFSAAFGSISVANTLGCAIENPVGGFVGENDGTISDSYATGDVVGRMSGDSEPYLGGFAGQTSGTITRAYALGAVTGSGQYSVVGGFAGNSGGGTISDAVAIGRVANDGIVTGGFSGYSGTTTRSYAVGRIKASAGNVGGFAGYTGSFASVYWDLNSSGISDPSKGCGNVPNCSGVVGLRTKDFKGKIPGGLNTSDWMQINFPFRSDYPKVWAPSFPITNFPISGYTPYSMPIITVFDHTLQTSPASGMGALYTCDQVVRAFEGSSGELKYGSDSPQCKYPGYKQQSGKNFVLGGVNYVGLPAKYLEYDGHPGFDYGAVFHSPVYAAVSGTVFYPWKAIGTASNNDTYCRFHTLAQIPDGAPTYRLYYLHLATHPAKKGQTNPTCSSPKDTDGETMSFTPQPDCYADLNGNPINPTTLPLPEGTHANAGCEIALSGDAGVPGSPHLHFEVQQMVRADGFPGNRDNMKYFACYDERKSYKQGLPGVDPYCLPADPYGYVADDTQCSGDPSTWTGDIWQCLTGLPSRRFWAQ